MQSKSHFKFVMSQKTHKKLLSNKLNKTKNVYFKTQTYIYFLIKLNNTFHMIIFNLMQKKCEYMTIIDSK